MHRPFFEKGLLFEQGLLFEEGQIFEGIPKTNIFSILARFGGLSGQVVISGGSKILYSEIY